MIAGIASHASTVLAAFVWSGSGLALVGGYSPVRHLVLGSVLGLTIGIARELSSPSRSLAAVSSATWGGRGTALIVIAISSASMGFVALRPNESPLVYRDPGLYTVKAFELAATGSPNTDLKDRSSIDLLDERRPRISRRASDDEITYQFGSAVPAFAALGMATGDPARVALPIAVAWGVGLLSFSVLGLWVIRRRWLAIMALLTLSVHGGMLYFARGTYSEPLAFALFAGALAHVVRMQETRSTADAVLAGWLLGSVALVRVDGLVNSAPMIAMAVVAMLTPGAMRLDRRRTMAFITMALVTTAMGYFELVVSSGWYLKIHLLGPLAGLALLVGGAAGGWLMWSMAANIPRRILRAASLATISVSVLGIGFGLLVRPNLGGTHADILPRLGYYIGTATVVIVFTAGAVILARPRAVGFVRWWIAATWGSSTALALMNPFVSPDNLWAMRRWFVAVIPGAVILLFLVVDQLLALAATADAVTPVESWNRPAAAVFSALAVFGLLWPSVALSSRYGSEREFAGATRTLDDTCSILGRFDLVAILDSRAPQHYGQLRNALPDSYSAFIRSRCQIPAYVVPERQDGRMLDEIEAALPGMDVALLSFSRESLVRRGAEQTSELVDLSGLHVPRVMGALPDGFEEQRFRVFLGTGS